MSCEVTGRAVRSDVRLRSRVFLPSPFTVMVTNAHHIPVSGQKVFTKCVFVVERQKSWGWEGESSGVKRDAGGV